MSLKVQITNGVQSLKEGDTATDIKMLLIEGNGTIYDFTGKEAKFVVSNRSGKLFERPVVSSDKIGEVIFSFLPGEVTGSGQMFLEIHINDDGTTRIFPSSDYLVISIDKNLNIIGQTITSYQFDNLKFDIGQDLGFEIVEVNGRIDNMVSEVSSVLKVEILDSAKITWVSPVDTFSSLATIYPSPALGDTSMVRDTGKVYRWDGASWLEIQDIDPTVINEVDTRLQTEIGDYSPFLNNGKLILPSDFPALPFSVFRNKKGDYYSDATPYNQFNWSDATQIYISCSATATNLGTSYLTPTTLAGFRTNFNASAYGSAKKFVLNLTENIYWLNSSASNAFILDIDADLLIRADNASGFSWLGRFKNPVINTYVSAWISDSSVFKTTQTTSHDILDVMNVNKMDEYRMPSLYKKVTTLTECQNTIGSFFRSAADVYVNPFSGEDANDLLLVVSSAVMTINTSFARTIIFENVGFAPSSYQTGTVNNIAARMYMFGCKFHRGLNNGYYVNGAFRVHNFDCIVSHTTLDCYNYHTTNTSSLATEVNCIGYGAGRYKLLTGQPTHSNNGSTAHDGMYMLRVGSRYFDCEGPIVADVNNCYSISIGVEASGILSSSTGTDAAFYYEDNVGDTELTSKPKYVLESKGYGNNVTIGVQGTNKTYVANFEGLKSFVGSVKQRGEFTW